MKSRLYFCNFKLQLGLIFLKLVSLFCDNRFNKGQQITKRSGDIVKYSNGNTCVFEQILNLIGFTPTACFKLTLKGKGRQFMQHHFFARKWFYTLLNKVTRTIIMMMI